MRRTAMLLALALTLLLVAPAVAEGAGERDPEYSRVASKLSGTKVGVLCWYSDAEWRLIPKPRDTVAFFLWRRIHLSRGICELLDRAAYYGWRPGPAGKRRLALAVGVFSHEIQHAAGFTGEKKAECFGMQYIELVADELGLGWRYGRNLARLYWRYLYDLNLPKYLSAACHAGGPWDLFEDYQGWP